jgi:hypothetical protein
MDFYNHEGVSVVYSSVSIYPKKFSELIARGRSEDVLQWTVYCIAPINSQCKTLERKFYSLSRLSPLCD